MWFGDSSSAHSRLIDWATDIFKRTGDIMYEDKMLILTLSDLYIIHITILVDADAAVVALKVSLSLSVPHTYAGTYKELRTTAQSVARYVL